MGVTRIYFYLTCLYLTTVVNSFNTYGADDLAASPIDLGKDVTPICESFAGAFADAAANYTRCFIVNSRPLSLCSNCIVQYLTVKQAYRQLEKVSRYTSHHPTFYLMLWSRLSLIDLNVKIYDWRERPVERRNELYIPD